MIAVPAIDLRNGDAVQLVGGEPASERIRVPDPLTVARKWSDAGFGSLHIVDLDAALGDGDNRTAIELLVRESGLPCQVGGGIRDDVSLRSLFDAGAARVIVGTRAIEDRPWLASAAHDWPDRLIVAADVRNGRVVTRGWTRATDIDATGLVEELSDLPLAGILVTDVGREGREQGVDAGLFARLVTSTTLPLQAAGGVSSIEDLRALDRAGVAAAVLGMALYTGRLDARRAAMEFST